jgi:hypothetical protein
MYYRKNESSIISSEKLKVTPKGMKIIDNQSEDWLDLAPGQDHLIVMRTLGAFGSIGMSMAI